MELTKEKINDLKGEGTPNPPSNRSTTKYYYLLKVSKIEMSLKKGTISKGNESSSNH